MKNVRESRTNAQGSGSRHLEKPLSDFAKIACFMKILKIPSTKNQIPGPDRMKTHGANSLNLCAGNE